MNINIALDEEELAAITEDAAANNYKDANDLAVVIVKNYITGLVVAKRARVVAEIGTATENLPYSDREELADLNRDFIRDKMAQRPE